MASYRFNPISLKPFLFARWELLRFSGAPLNRANSNTPMAATTIQMHVHTNEYEPSQVFVCVRERKRFCKIFEQKQTIVLQAVFYLISFSVIYYHTYLAQCFGYLSFRNGVKVACWWAPNLPTSLSLSLLCSHTRYIQMVTLQIQKHNKRRPHVRFASHSAFEIQHQHQQHPHKINI